MIARLPQCVLIKNFFNVNLKKQLEKNNMTAVILLLSNFDSIKDIRHGVKHSIDDFSVHEVTTEALHAHVYEVMQSQWGQDKVNRVAAYYFTEANAQKLIPKLLHNSSCLRIL